MRWASLAAGFGYGSEVTFYTAAWGLGGMGLCHDLPWDCLNDRFRVARGLVSVKALRRQFGWEGCGGLSGAP